MNRTYKRVLTNTLTLTLLLGLAKTGIATDYYWDINGATSGPGTLTSQAWDEVNTFWNTDSGGGSGTFIANPGAGDTITLSAGTTTATYAVTIPGGATRSVLGLTIEDGGTTGSGSVTLSGGTSLTIGASGISSPNQIGNMTISTPIILGTSQTWNQANLSNGLSPASISDGGNGYKLTKTGGGRLNYVGNNYSYTGGTLISAGTLRVNSANTVSLADGANNIVTNNVNYAGGGVGGLVFGGSLAANTQIFISTLAGTGNIFLQDFVNSNAVDLTLGATNGNYANTTYSGALSGTGRLTNNNLNTLTLTGNSTYTGGTTLNNGVINLGVGQSGTGGPLGGSGAVSTVGIIVFGGGALQFSTNNVVDYSSRFSQASGQAYRLDTNGQTVNWGTGRDPSGTGTLTKLGAGTLNVTTVTNGWTGATTINAGVLRVGGLANINTDSSIGQGSVAGSAADLVFGGGTLQYLGGAPTSTNRLFTIGNANGLTATLDSSAVSAANTLSFNGTGAIGFGGSGARTLTLTGSNTGSNTLASILGDGSGGATALTKSGNGTWVLSGANTYTGVTQIDAGILALSGSGAISSSLDLNGGTLQTSSNLALASLIGVGSITGGNNVSVSTSFSPGHSAGTINETGSFTLGGSATSTIEIDLTSDTFDELNVTGLMTYGGVLNVLFSGADPLAASYDVFDFGSFAGSFSSFTYSGLGGGQTATFTPSTGVVSVSPVPEPSTFAMLLFGAIGVWLMRRK